MNKQINSSLKPKEKLIGLVKWFDSDKGFGVIGTPDEGEYFLHINSFLRKLQSISKETSVVFSAKANKIKNRNDAENCRLVGGELEDWKLILSYLSKPDNIYFEIEGHSYHRKEYKSLSLMELSAKQFFRENSENVTAYVIIHYYKNELESKYFIAYCEFIENSITKYFPIDASTKILNEIFSYFGKNHNDDILFQVWKYKKFKFISCAGLEEQEIAEVILDSHIAEIGILELERIKNFSFGITFCTKFVKNKLDDIDNFSSCELKNLYQFLEFADKDERERLKYQLDNLYIHRITTELTEQANNLETIKNCDDFIKYNNIFNLIPNQIEEEDRNIIINELNKIIISKCSEDFLPELWIKGIVAEIPFESISKIFLNNDAYNNKKILILSKITLNQQFELLKIYSIEYNFEEAFNLIEGLVKKENSLNDYFRISNVLFDKEFWKDKKLQDLANLFIDYVKNKCSNEQKYELFFKGYVKDIPHDIVFQNISVLDKEKCIKIFKSESKNKTFIKEILERKIADDNNYNLYWLYNLAQDFLDDDDFNSFDKKVFENIEQAEYFNLWKNGSAKIFPGNHIEELLADDYKQYSQIENWINNNAITQEDITDFLFAYLKKQVHVTNRKIFHKQLNHIKYLLQIDELNLEKVKRFQNDIFNIICWFLDKGENLNFELLKRKFIYFTPDEQVRIVRKLFFLKAIGQFDLTVEKINELTRFDLDLYKNNLKYNPDILVDISTDVIIKALLSFKEKHCFLVETELLSVVLSDLKHDKTKKFKLLNYFEECKGREITEFPKCNWATEGEIKKIFYGTNQFNYAISFSLMEKSGYYYDRWGNKREEFYKNPRFEELKEAVKLLPDRKWNPQSGHWEIPGIYENQVMEFAKEYRFSIESEGNKYENNIHLADFFRKNKPNGIEFCEGRLANKLNELFKKEFWWCAGETCFSKCETIHSTEEWEKYTLLDFCEILGFNTDETNRIGDYIPKGYYYQFISLINRFNNLLDKLYCRDCNHILYPVDTSHFSAYTVVRFHCVNENCSNNEEVYLNHCLNGKCNNIIDSRVSKRCENGLFICDKCGSCCSDAMLTRRLNNLELTGGYINENLRRCVNEKLGHLERGRYFCYKCGDEMIETSSDIFRCNKCNVEYDTAIYKFKRPNKYLKRNNNDSHDNNVIAIW